LLLRLAGVFVPGRERGKAGWLQMLDVARAACRRIGTIHAREHRLEHSDDVFFLVRSELEAPGPDVAARIAERRAAHARCARLRVPFWWTGNLDTRDVEPVEADRPASLQGLGAYGGAVRGRAVVAEDPSEIDLEPDDVLVCHTTDPAWIPHFLTAAAVVIDVGGSLSHGVIAARELGVVCVVSTGNATQVIRTGDQITVDGAGGLVTIHHHAGGTG
jgi:pyruvate,water dikinase